jgi:hypothetical protein
MLARGVKTHGGRFGKKDQGIPKILLNGQRCQSLQSGTTVEALRHGHGSARGVKTHGGRFKQKEKEKEQAPKESLKIF